MLNLRTSLGVCWAVALLSSLPALADVQLELRPASQSAVAGQNFEVQLYAVANNEPVGQLEAVLSWNPSFVTLVGKHSTGAFGWSFSGFPNHTLNDTWSDGNALYRANINTQCIAATATPSGLLVTTLIFRGTAATASTSMQILGSSGGTNTRVWNNFTLVCGGVAYATTPLGPAVTATINACTGAGQCGDGDGCTNDACTSGVCTHTPNWNPAIECCNPATGAKTALSDGNDCTQDVCNTGTGTVTHPNESPGTACGDPTDDLCTSPDTCDGGGTCLPNNNVNGSFCEHPDDCVLTAECQDGLCEGLTFEDNGTTCEDGSICTGRTGQPDTCQGGECISGPTPCTDSQKPLCFEIEDPNSCCDENNPACSAGCDLSFTCVEGRCMFAQCGNCADDAQCPPVGCVQRDCFDALHVCQTAFLDHEGCQNGVFCDGQEVCHEPTGACIDGPDPCSGGTPNCREDLEACVECLIDADCPPVNACQSRSCNQATGFCELDTPTDCSDFNDPCNIGVCNTTSGQCSAQAAETVSCPCPAGYTCDTNANKCNPQACSDGNPCTTFDQCDAGVCIGEPPVSSGPVNLSLLPATTTVSVGTSVNLNLRASTTSSTPKSVNVVEAVLRWPVGPVALTGSTDPCNGVSHPINDCPAGQYDWFFSGFPSGGFDPDGLNGSFADGNAFYIAQVEGGDPSAPVSNTQPLTVTTLQFSTSRATTSAGVQVFFDPCFGATPSFTRVIGPGNVNQTGSLTLATIKVNCTLSSQCNDDNDCTTDACDSGTGFCTFTPKVAGTACGNQTPISECDQPDVCNASGTCVPNFKPSGTPCTDDGIACTINECDGNGVCVGNPDDALCDDSESCTDDTCSPSLGCVFTPDDTNPCNDGDNCTIGDACTNGTCLGTPKDCSQLDGQCVVGVCNPSNGQCVTQPANENQSCDDGLFCNVNEKCSNGLCSGGGPRDCSDGGPCTVDSCNETNDVCMHTPDDNFCPDNDVFCDGVEFCNPATGQCVSSGDPCPGACSETQGCPCDGPTVVSPGCRYLGIRPVPIDSVAPFRLLVESPDFPCLSKYVGYLACTGTTKRCKTTADCNACTVTNKACLTNADCKTCSDQANFPCQTNANCNPGATCVQVQTCQISGQTCDAVSNPPTFDIDGDMVPDGTLATLVDDPADALNLTPLAWVGNAQDRCTRGDNLCISDSDCDIGQCLLSDGRPSATTCSVSANNCPPGFFGCQRAEICLKAQVYVSAEDIIPSDKISGSVVPVRYGVMAECGSLTSPTTVTMKLWADTAEGNNLVNVTDVSFILLVFQRRFDAARGITIVACDLVEDAPCKTNQLINAADLQRTLKAFQGQTYRNAVTSSAATTGCSLPCE